MDRQPVFLIDSRPSRMPRILVLGALLLVTAIGAWKLRFLCDDAFITFRYVSNAHDGLGLVWNPPPFRPVEGYTGFSWALLLWATWSWFGVAPPDAANVLSLGCGLLQFAVCAAAALRLRDRFGNRLPDGIGLLTMAVLASNRSFLQWMTSGLETALFNLCFVSWVLLAFRNRERRGARWLMLWSTAAMFAALTRPDGLLLVAATAAAALWLVVARRLATGRAAVGLLPLLLVAAHVLWRHAFYGEWLPNTYFAKVTEPWPKAGWRYLYCFSFEHGAWLWPLVALAALVAAMLRRSVSLRALFTDHLPATAAVSAVLFHVGYYVLRVGGDHFEYRVLSHTIPLGILATAAMAARLRNGVLAPTIVLLLLGAAQSVTWVHHVLTRTDEVLAYDSFTDKLPAWLQPLTRAYDRNQFWLQVQSNCLRIECHEATAARLAAGMPPRERMMAGDDVPVHMAFAVGMIGWALPDVAVIDLHGLNDWVVARSPLRAWSVNFLPPEALDAMLTHADPDHDGTCTYDELRAAFAPPGTAPPDRNPFLDRMLLLFARRSPQSLTGGELAELAAFFRGFRFMAHERVAPTDYAEAFDANVTVVDHRVVVRRRATPLTADRVRAIEAEWRQRIVDQAVPR